MKKWVIGGEVLGALAVLLLAGILVTGVLAQEPASPASFQGPLTPEQAEAVALEANPGATVVRVDQELEHGALVYEVQLDNGMEVEVDASDGAILEMEQDDDGGSEVEDADGPDDVDGIDDVDDADDASDSTDG